MSGIKHKVHIYMIHPKVHSAKELYSALQLENIDELEYEFIWDADNPQFIVVTDLIYTNAMIRREFSRMYNNHVVTIFRASECVAPDLNLFDYAICFDDSIGEGRVISHVQRDFYQEYIIKRENEFEYNIALAKEALLNKTGFCNFIYSNPNGHKNRENIFHALNEYKRIDSLGAFLNSVCFLSL